MPTLNAIHSVFSIKQLLQTLLILLFFIAPGFGQSQQRPPDPDPHRFDNQIQRFVKWDRQNSVPTNAVLFVGSSSIRGWQTAKSFPGLPVINRGFGGSQISDVIYFAETIVLPYSPKVIVFYAGDNDIADGKTAETVAADFRTFVQQVHAQLPLTAIIYIPIKPSLQRWALWNEMKRANALITAICATDNRLEVANIASPMIGHDGTPRKNVFLKDGLHLNAEGYALWTQVVRPYIINFLKPAAEK